MDFLKPINSVLDGVLGFADILLDLAFSFLASTFSAQTIIVCGLTGGLLGLASNLISGAFDFISHATHHLASVVPAPLQAVRDKNEW